ncbi:hypothetical protein NFI96_030868, partial [Prochilodus magdalenae]
MSSDSGTGRCPQAVGLVYVLQVWKFAAYDGLCCPHHSLQGLEVVGSTAAVPDSDTGHEDALYGASVEVGEDVRRQTKRPEPSQEEESLMGPSHGCCSSLALRTERWLRDGKAEALLTRAAEAEDLKEESFISVKAGENVTLPCKVEKPVSAVKAWYKQSLWQKPKEVASKLDNKNPLIPDSKFSLNGEFSLSIKETSDEDEGMYFCGKSDGKTFTFYHILNCD